MLQQIIVYIILAGVAGGIIYRIIKAGKNKKKNDNCHSSGCSSCPLKDKCGSL